MFRLYLKVAFVFFIIFSMLVLMRLMTSDRTNPVDELLATRQNCNNVCLFRIEPGRTNIGQAKSYLSANDWIVDIREFAPGNGYAQISWGWSGNQPIVIDASRRGTLTFVWDDDDPEHTKINDSLVETISVYTHGSIYLFEQYYGTPLNGSVNNQLEGRLGYAVYYNRSGGSIGLRIEISCPASLVKYWSAKTHMTVSIGQIKSPYISPVDLIKMC